MHQTKDLTSLVVTIENVKISTTEISSSNLIPSTPSLYKLFSIFFPGKSPTYSQNADQMFVPIVRKREQKYSVHCLLKMN